MSQTIVASDGRLWTLPEFVRSPEEAAEQDRLLAAKFFLVRQGSLGEIFRCVRCHQKHQFLTLACCERPFSGATQGLWAYLSVAGTPQAIARMTLNERARYELIRRLFNDPQPVPDLSTSHPQMARSLAVGEHDVLRGAVPLGILEEIPRALAQRFQDRVNLRLPAAARLSVPGLTP